MTRRNAFDKRLDRVLQAMQRQEQSIERRGDADTQFDSKRLPPDEEALIYDNPAAAFPGAMDAETGMPLTNQQAAHRLLQERGPEWYIAWVERMERQRPTPPLPEEVPL